MHSMCACLQHTPDPAPATGRKRQHAAMMLLLELCRCCCCCHHRTTGAAYGQTVALYNSKSASKSVFSFTERAGPPQLLLEAHHNATCTDSPQYYAQPLSCGLPLTYGKFANDLNSIHLRLTSRAQLVTVKGTCDLHHARFLHQFSSFAKRSAVEAGCLWNKVKHKSLTWCRQPSSHKAWCAPASV